MGNGLVAASRKGGKRYNPPHAFYSREMGQRDTGGFQWGLGKRG
jgi:hypothetical protein